MSSFNPSALFVADYVGKIQQQHQPIYEKSMSSSFVIPDRKYEDSLDLLPLQMNLPCIRQVDLDR
jgi:hypothetical protein